MEKVNAYSSLLGSCDYFDGRIVCSTLRLIVRALRSSQIALPFAVSLSVSW